MIAVMAAAACSDVGNAVMADAEKQDAASFQNLQAAICHTSTRLGFEAFHIASNRVTNVDVSSVEWWSLGDCERHAEERRNGN